jgi:hypothetical protein
MTDTSLKARNFLGALKILLALCVMDALFAHGALAQEGERPRRGIEKKDIRIVVIYDESAVKEQQAQMLLQEMQAAYGAKLTKADAARQGGPKKPSLPIPPTSPGPTKPELPTVDERTKLTELKPLRELLSESFMPGEHVLFIAGKQVGGGDDDLCPPVDCGCNPGAVDCVCTVWRDKNKQKHCMCRLCFLSPGSATGSPNRFINPSVLGKPTVFVVVGEDLQKKLASADWWQRNSDWFQKEVLSRLSPTTADLTIKTKSCPP